MATSRSSPARRSATKNGKDCKQYIKPDLATELRASLEDYGKVFKGMPDRQHVAEMLRADLAAARAAWVKETQDAERAWREKATSCCREPRR